MPEFPESKPGVVPGGAEPDEPPPSPQSRRRQGGRRLAQIELSAEQQAKLASSPRDQQPSAQRRVWPRVRRVFKWLAWGSVGVLVVALGMGFAGFAHYSRGLPSVADLKAGYDPPQLTKILARDETVLATIFTERRTVISFEQVPDAGKLAFLAAEDAFFYEHEGLNYLGMVRALLVNLRAGKTTQGASTITQQVVKNLLLTPHRSYERKIKETLLARRLEQELSKDEIFWLYLNHIYLGHGRYGIEEATRYYFGKPAKEIRLDEAALLAGLVAAPERFSPRRDPDKALGRRHYVLQQMLDKGFVTAALYEEMDTSPLRLAPEVETESELAPEMLAESAALLKELAGDRKQGGYTVTTTLDPELQGLGRRAVRKGLDAYAARRGLLPPFGKTAPRGWGKPLAHAPSRHQIYVGVVEATDDRTGTLLVRAGDMVGRVSLSQEPRYNPENLPASEFAKPGSLLRVRLGEEPTPEHTPVLRLELGPQAALVAIDVRSREVRALVGSYEAWPGGFDRASHARRQPGSAFKPVTYSYALHSRRFTPSSLLPSGSKAGQVMNAGGPAPQIRLRQALAQSDNQASVFLFDESGPRSVVDWAHALGIASEMKPDESLALGAYEVTPLEMANAYATFASGGVFEPPRLFESIKGPDGQPIALPPVGASRRVMEADEAYLITSLLRSVVETGTGQGARRVGRPVAGKTGTSNQAKDAWFVGFSTDFAVAVWVGYDDGLPLGESESGGHTAVPIWTAFMKEAHRQLPVTDFSRPASLVVTDIDPKTGLLPYAGQTDTMPEEFLPGSMPTEVAPDPTLPPPPGLGLDDPELAEPSE